MRAHRLCAMLRIVWMEGAGRAVANGYRNGIYSVWRRRLTVVAQTTVFKPEDAVGELADAVVV